MADLLQLLFSMTLFFIVLQEGSYCDFIGFSMWGSKGNFNISLLEVVVVVIVYIVYLFIYLCMCVFCISVSRLFPIIEVTICLQVICALILLAKEGSLKRSFNQWTLIGSLTASGLPAAIYALQNSLLQISYKNLDSLSFSILNQTKLIFTALFTYVILGYVFGVNIGKIYIFFLSNITCLLFLVSRYF